MALKEKIIQELKNTGVANIDKMLQYMERHRYYECRSSSHNHWTGGASQHMWAVYLIAKALRDKKLKEKDAALFSKYATDQKLAIVCLLHDLCDMHVTVKSDKGKDVSYDHGNKSYWIMKNLDVGTEAEREAVRNHMKSNCHHHLKSQQEIEEYNVLHSLVHQADHFACGTAWNSTRFKGNRTQVHNKTTCRNDSYLLAVAMDRSVQSGRKNCHFYVDEKFELREYKNYNRNLIKWNRFEHVIRNLNDKTRKVQLDNITDVISAVHKRIIETGERLCIVVGVSNHIPKDKNTRLRRGRIDEQDILICSNLLNSFYDSNVCEEKGKRRHRFEFTMREEIKAHYKELPKQKGGIYLPNVKMIRDGQNRGFPFVEPWDVDLLLVPGKKFPMFAIKASKLTNSI